MGPGSSSRQFFYYAIFPRSPCRVRALICGPSRCKSVRLFEFLQRPVEILARLDRDAVHPVAALARCSSRSSPRTSRLGPAPPRTSFGSHQVCPASRRPIPSAHAAHRAQWRGHRPLVSTVTTAATVVWHALDLSKPIDAVVSTGIDRVVDTYTRNKMEIPQQC